MATRGRQHIKNKMVGTTRMDAALDAMRQFGFEKRLVRKTVEELLDVYEGTQGWPFIEEASYKLLIETILGKQSSPAEDKVNERRDCVTETSSATTPITGITNVDSFGLVAQETVLHASDGLDSASQTNNQDSALLGNTETDVKDSTVQVDRGGQGIIVEPKNKLKSADNAKGSNYSTLVSNVESTSAKTPTNQSSEAFHNSKLVSNVENTSAKTPTNQSSEAFHNMPCLRRRRYLGWIGIEDNVEHIHFPLPPLSKQIEKLIGKCEAPQNGSRRRGKSRWDEKPDGM